MVVSLSTSAGSATQTIPVRVGPAASEPPRAVGEPPSLTLAEGGARAEVRVGAFFRVAAGQESEVAVDVRSASEGVATAHLEGTGLSTVVIVTPVGQGSTTVVVVLSTSAGSATQTININVAPAPTDPPRVVSVPRSVLLVHGGAWRRWHLQDLFTTGDHQQDRSTQVEARSEDERVVTTRIEANGLVGSLFLTPLNPGETTVVVKAENAAGSAVLRIQTTVLPAESPRLTNQPGPLTLVAGARGYSLSLRGAFAPPGFLAEARSLDETVVRVEARPGSASVFPVGPGETFVVVTARNAAGSAEMIVKVTVLMKLHFGLVSRLGPAGGPAVRLAEGGQWSVEIQPLIRGTRGTHFSDVTFAITTDAPADELIVPESILADVAGSGAKRVSFFIRAPADDTPGEPARTYTVSLVSADELPPWAELSEDPLRVTVLDSPAATCEDLRVTASLDPVSDGVRRGTFWIQAPHLDTSVSWADPYENLTGDDRWPAVALYVSPERLPFRELPRGFEQEVGLRWWASDLRWTIQAPGCEPFELHCDEFTCDFR